MKPPRIVFVLAALALGLSLGSVAPSEAATYCPPDIKRTQPTGCCPWQYRAGNQCLDRSDATEHPSTHAPASWQRCWKLTTCSCQQYQTPIGGGQCAPCAFTGVRVYCIRR